MKKVLTITLVAYALAAFTACGNEEDDRTTEQVEAGTEIEIDTAITQDPDTTTYHDMAL
ncbi:hypothetical protein ACFS7Z_22965 [Pontibacter toksunensis]|uniref:Uncharacterized protein n=1 Tax=Pontibacter toksunensis TaxID=1332631 RepID=A0ABW6C1F4_9BACT